MSKLTEREKWLMRQAYMQGVFSVDVHSLNAEGRASRWVKKFGESLIDYYDIEEKGE